MAPPRKSRPGASHSSPHSGQRKSLPATAAATFRQAKKTVGQYANVDFAKSLLFDPAQLHLVRWAILLAELVLNVLVVQRVRYTEIDWRAYMQECEGFLNGTYNYAELRGDTGPLVYPAGFVYIYSALYYLTDQGRNIRLAQYIFVAIYLLQMHLVLRLYTRALKVPPYVLLITTFTSYRIHSIYVLRLFNDPVAMVLLYAALNCYASGRWTWGSVLLSLGVGVKMNVLLFAPAILVLLLTNVGWRRTVAELALCAGIQVALGAPFLWHAPVAYLRGSFDVGRVFEHKWTVNWRFVEREWFEWRGFHAGLLAVHVGLLVALAPVAWRYMRAYAGLRVVQEQFERQIAAKNAEGGGGGGDSNGVGAGEEELDADQQQFLQSFERTLAAGKGAKAVAAAKQKQQLEQQQQYSLNCGKSVQLILLPIFLANFIGVACARSLHYQFYVWYFHSLPYLVWSTAGYSTSVRFLLLGLLEFAWNTYPSTEASSVALHGAHAVLLWGVVRTLWRRTDVAAAAPQAVVEPADGKTD